MNEYTFTTDKWYIFDTDLHGKLHTGLHLATSKNITLWYDTYLEYVDVCLDNGITPISNDQ